jgi:hypothetical protein
MTRSPGQTRSRALLAMLLASALGAGCDPYQRFGEGDDHLGPVNPVNFPAANLGTGGNRMQAGRGTFTETLAFVGGQPVGYFAYPLPPALLMSADPLRLTAGGMPVAGLSRPTAVVFDPANGSPFPQQYKCQAPSGNYQYDPYVDDVPQDEQGPVFSALPTATYNPGVASATTYVPLVTQLTGDSSGGRCQRWKSRKQIDEAVSKNALPAPGNDGRLLAWMIIDPSAGVYPFDMGPTSEHPGVGLQRWGWYNRYLLAYIDGGYVPTVEATVMGGTMAMPTTTQVTRIRPQRLFYPRSPVIRTGAMAATPGARGQGYDVLEAARGTDAYSPVCQVFTYDASMPPMMPMAPVAPVAQANLPTDAATIQAMFGATIMPVTATPFIFCLQVVK